MWPIDFSVTFISCPSTKVWDNLCVNYFSLLFWSYSRLPVDCSWIRGDLRGRDPIFLLRRSGAGTFLGEGLLQCFKIRHGMYWRRTILIHGGRFIFIYFCILIVHIVLVCMWSQVFINFAALHWFFFIDYFSLILLLLSLSLWKTFLKPSKSCVK